MNKHRSIQRTEYPKGWQPKPSVTESDYNKKMKVLTNRFNNWAKYIKKQNENQL